jgi:fatty-acid desaturase
MWRAIRRCVRSDCWRASFRKLARAVLASDVQQHLDHHIPMMQILLILLIAVAAAATLFVLVRGVIGMAQGSTTLNSARSQKLMQKRVIYQAAALLFAMLVMLVGRSA